MHNERLFAAELTTLRPHGDTVQGTENVQGYLFITTAAHGFLVVPKGDEYGTLAASVYEASAFSYEGKHAFYLEEDCDRFSFLSRRREMIEGRRFDTLGNPRG